MRKPRVAATIAFSLAILVGAPAGAARAVSDPTGLLASDNVSLLTSIPNPGAIGARFRDGVMYVTSLAGLTTYDITTPASPRLIGTLPLPHFENEDVDLGGNILLISNDAAESTGILYVIDITNPAAPTLLSTMQMGGNPLFAGPGHTASCIRDCRFAWVTDNAGIRVIDLRDPAHPVNLGTFETPAGGDVVTHDVQVDTKGLAWVVGFGGTAAYKLPRKYDGTGLGTLVAKTDPTGNSTYFDEFGLGDGGNPNDFIHHNSFRRKSVVLVTEEDYTRPGCRGAGSFQTWKLPATRGGLPTGEDMTLLDQWTTELLADTAAPAAVCSAHYFDVRGDVVAQGWYEQGVRFLDVSNPSNIRQIGFFVPPNSATWGAYFAPTDPSGRIVYSVDASHGIDVLEFERPNDLSTAATLGAPVRSEWTTAAPATGAPSTTYGFACRISL
jgi:hypothetical protein